MWFQFSCSYDLEYFIRHTTVFPGQFSESATQSSDWLNQSSELTIHSSELTYQVSDWFIQLPDLKLQVSDSIQFIGYQLIDNVYGQLYLYIFIHRYIIMMLAIRTYYIIRMDYEQMITDYKSSSLIALGPETVRT